MDLPLNYLLHWLLVNLDAKYLSQLCQTMVWTSCWNWVTKPANNASWPYRLLLWPWLQCVNATWSVLIHIESFTYFILPLPWSLQTNPRKDTCTWIVVLIEEAEYSCTRRRNNSNPRHFLVSLRARYLYHPVHHSFHLPTGPFDTSTWLQLEIIHR